MWHELIIVALFGIFLCLFVLFVWKFVDGGDLTFQYFDEPEWQVSFSNGF